MTKLLFFITKHWDAIIAALAASAFIYFYTQHSGIGISPDSVNYESAATNIRNHFSFTDFNGLPLVDFPLGYPCFLALASLLSGLTVLQVTPVLNGLLFSGAILLTSIIITGYQRTSHIYKICILALLACSPCLLEVYSMLWSETLFIFLVLLFVVLIRNYFNTFRTPSLLVVSLVVAIAFVTRYAGITLLAAGVFLIFFNGSIAIQKKFKHLLLFVATGSSLFIINLIRNGNAAGHITGVREKALRTLPDILKEMGTTVSEWLPFVKGHETISVVVFLCILLFAVCLLIYHLLQQQYFSSYQTILAVVFVAYALFMITIATISRFEYLTNRLLSPLYIPMLLTGSSWICSVTQKLFRTRRMIFTIFTLIVYGGFQYTYYRLNAQAWEGIKDAGIPGYREDSWTQSPMVAMVKKNKSLIMGPVYANANDAVYFLTGIHATALPHKEIQQEIDVFLQHPSFYLIWFVDGDNPDLIGLDFIKQHKKLVSIHEVEGGAIYFFSDSALAPLPK